MCGRQALLKGSIAKGTELRKANSVGAAP
jgi:hypothetical protein